MVRIRKDCEETFHAVVDTEEELQKFMISLVTYTRCELEMDTDEVIFANDVTENGEYILVINICSDAIDKCFKLIFVIESLVEFTNISPYRKGKIKKASKLLRTMFNANNFIL